MGYWTRVVGVNGMHQGYTRWEDNICCISNEEYRCGHLAGPYELLSLLIFTHMIEGISCQNLIPLTHKREFFGTKSTSKGWPFQKPQVMKAHKR